MALNIITLADQLYSSFKISVLTSVANASPVVLGVATTYVLDEEKTLKDLAITFLNKEIDMNFLLDRLKDVKQDFITALISIEQIIASDVQSLVDSLINIFTSLLTAALSVIKPSA